MKNISITKKLNYLQNRLNDLSTTMISRMVNQLSNYLHEIDVNSFWHAISLMEVEKKEAVTTVLNDFKTKKIFVCPTEEKFLHYLLEKVHIDLTEEEKERFIIKVIESILMPLHVEYIRRLFDETLDFSLNFWQKYANNNSFIEFISTLYFYKNKFPFYMYSKFGEMPNHLEALSFAKEEIPDLIPVYEKIMHQVFTYSENNRKDYFIPYPLNIQQDKKCFLAEYIMKTPKEKFHPKAKTYFLEKNPNRNFSYFALAILASDNFTEEEKLSVINRLNQYQEIPKEKREYYEDTYDEILNDAYYGATILMIDYTVEDIIAIDTKKLYDLEEQEQRLLLEQIIEKDRLHGLYYPYYYTDTYHVDGKSPEEIKKIYIDNFIALSRFLKQEEKIHSFSLTRIGTVYKGEIQDKFNMKSFAEQEFQENVILRIECQLQRRKI